MINQISPRAKPVEKVALHVMHNFLVCYKHTWAEHEPSSPSTKELHGIAKTLLLEIKKGERAVQRVKSLRKINISKDGICFPVGRRHQSDQN